MSTTHLLDTNIVSFLMRPKPPASVLARLAALGPKRVAISVITAIELHQGAELSSKPAQYHRLIDTILESLPVLPLERELIPVAGRLRAQLQRQGTPLGDLDSLIAAHALALKLVLVTHDSDFDRVPDLMCEDWA